MSDKPKIQKTNRIRVNMHGTIYCSYDIIREVRHHLFRTTTQIMIPLKNHKPELIKELKNLVEEKPDHFTESSKLILDSAY